MNISDNYAVNATNYHKQNKLIQTQNQSQADIQNSGTFVDAFIKSSQAISQAEISTEQKTKKDEFFEKVNIHPDYVAAYQKIPAEYFEWMNLDDSTVIDFFEDKSNLLPFMGLVDYLSDTGMASEYLSKLDFYTAGTNSLTNEQIKSLKNTYDVTNMTDSQRFGLLMELNAMGALSFKELTHSCVFVCDVSKQGLVDDGRGPLMSGEFFGKGSEPTNWIEMILLMQKEDMGAYKDLLKQGHNPGDWFLNRHNKVLEIFEILAGYNEETSGTID